MPTKVTSPRSFGRTPPRPPKPSGTRPGVRKGRRAAARLPGQDGRRSRVCLRKRSVGRQQTSPVAARPIVRVRGCSLVLGAPRGRCTLTAERTTQGMRPPSSPGRLSQDFNILSRNLTDGVGRLRYIRMHELMHERYRASPVAGLWRCTCGTIAGDRSRIETTRRAARTRI